MPFATTNGVSLRYEVIGQGPPLCLIIGYRLHGGAWPEAFIEKLARNFSVLAFDNRGTGLSDKPAGGYAIGNLAEDVAGLLDEIGWSSAHVLGFSMGGTVAQELAIRYPKRVNKLILFATFSGGLFGVPASAAVLNRLTDVQGLLPEEAARQAWPVTYTREFRAANPEVVEQQMRREIAHPTPDHVAQGQTEALRAFSSNLRLWQIEAETLVVTGEEDMLVPPSNSRLLASAISRAKLVILPELGHRAIWEAPDEMAEFLSGFLLRG